MAKNAYVGVSDKARKIKKMYVGVGDKARKIVKAYVGVGGKARKFFPPPTYTTFTSSVAPTSWSGTSAAADAIFSASNTYGSWELRCNKATSASANCAKYAVDNDSSSYLKLKQTGVTCNLDLELPTGIGIKATQASVTAKYINKSMKVYGYNGSSWVSLGSPFSSNVTSTKTTKTLTISNTTYFSRFRLTFEPYSDYAEIYDFKITKGTLMDDR